MYIRIKSAILIMLFTVISPAVSQEYRNKLSSPPNAYYKEMLKRSLTGEYEMILQALDQVRPVTDALQRKYGARLQSEIRYAVEHEQQEEIIYLVLKLIFWDMVDLLHLVESDSNMPLPVLASRVRIAYLDYELLALIVKDRDRFAHERIENDFAQAISTLEDNEVTELTDEEKGRLRGIFRTIEGECLKIFPGFSLQYYTDEPAEAGND